MPENMEVSDSETGWSVYKCLHCSVRFVNFHSLSLHMKAHSAHLPTNCSDLKSKPTGSVQNGDGLSKRANLLPKELELNSANDKQAPGALICSRRKRNLHEEVNVQQEHSFTASESGKSQRHCLFTTFSQKGETPCNTPSGATGDAPHLMSPAKDQSYTCPECHISFTHSSELLRHLCSHSECKPNGYTRPSDSSKCRSSCVTMSNPLVHAATITVNSTGDCMRKGVKVKMSHNPRPYGCKECDATFVLGAHLSRHLRTHHNLNNLFRCQACDATFCTKRKLKLHLCALAGQTSQPRRGQISRKSHHARISHKCMQCGVNFSTPSRLTNHKCPKSGRCELVMREKNLSAASRSNKHKSIGGGVMKCNICNADFKSPQWLKSHMSCHSGPTPHKCNACDATFNKFSFLKWHITRLHRPKKSFENECRQAAPTNTNIVRPRMFTHSQLPDAASEECGFASPRLTTNTSSSNDTSTSGLPSQAGTEGICMSRASADVGETSSGVKLSSDTDSIHGSLNATGTTAKPDGKNAQMETSSNGKPSTDADSMPGCPNADGTTMNTDDSVNFASQNCTIKTEHSELKESNGAESISFSEKMRAIALEKATSRHAEDQPYKCGVCQTVYEEYVDLSKHMQIHEESRLYICCPCNRTFSRVSNLKDHVKKHRHPGPYACKVCGSSFKALGLLALHLAHHEESKLFVCQICKFSCSRACSLKKHIARHKRPWHSSKDGYPALELKSEKGTYLCEKCNITFKKALNYKMHMVRHMDKPFRCPRCTSSFTRRVNLREHMERHHTAHGSTAVQKQLNCEHCHVTFTALSSLNRHMNSTRCARQNSVNRVEIRTGQGPKSREERRNQSIKCRDDEDGQDPKSPEVEHVEQKLNRWTRHTRENVKLQKKKTKTGQKPLASQQDTVAFKVPEDHLGQKKFCIELKSYYCQQCRDTFPNQHSLSMHNQKFHQTVETSVTDKPCGLQPKVSKTSAGSDVTPRLKILKSKVAKKSTKSDGIHKSNTLRSNVVRKTAKSDGRKHTQSDGTNMETEMGTTFKRFYCYHCKATFTRNFNLKVHMQKHQTQTKQSQQNERVVPVTGANKLPEGIQVADITGEMSVVKSEAVEEHAKPVGVSLLECEPTTGTASDSSPVKSAEENNASSNDVPKSKVEKDSASDLQQWNMKRRSILKPFTCHHCNTSFIRQYSLKIHLMKHQKWTESEAKQRGHKQLDMPAADSKQLPAHTKSSEDKGKWRKVKSEHVEPRGSDRQSLSECQQKGSVPNSVQIHHAITPEEESSKQNATESTSVKRKGSAVHRRKANKSLQLKPFACHYCSASFTRHYNRKVHMQKHEKQSSCERDQTSAAAPDTTQLANHPKTLEERDETQALDPLVHVNSTSGRMHKGVKSEFPLEPPETPEWNPLTGNQNGDSVPEPKASGSSVVDAAKSKEAAASTKSDEMKIGTEGKSGGKSFVCQHCSASFTRYYNLQRHLKRHEIQTDSDLSNVEMRSPDPSNLTSLVKSADVTEKNDLGIAESEEDTEPMKADEQNQCKTNSAPDSVHLSAVNKSLDENGECQGSNSENILGPGKPNSQKITPREDVSTATVHNTGGRMLKADKKGSLLGNKPFFCEHCNGTFATLYNLKRHVIKHEKQSDCEQNHVGVTASDASELPVDPILLAATSTVSSTGGSEHNGAKPKFTSEEVSDSCSKSSEKKLKSFVVGSSQETSNSLVSKSIDEEFEEQGIKSSHGSLELGVSEHTNSDTTVGCESHVRQPDKCDEKTFESNGDKFGTKAMKPGTVKEPEVASQFKKSDEEKHGSVVNRSGKCASIAQKPENTGKSHIKPNEDKTSWLVQSSQSFEAWTSNS